MIETDNKNISIEKVHLFGGATSHSDVYEWKHTSEIVKYGIHNFYSQKDSVLKYLYKTFELGDNPIGLNPISSNSKNIKNYEKDIFCQYNQIHINLYVLNVDLQK